MCIIWTGSVTQGDGAAVYPKLSKLFFQFETMSKIVVHFRWGREYKIRLHAYGQLYTQPPSVVITEPSIIQEHGF